MIIPIWCSFFTLLVTIISGTEIYVDNKRVYCDQANSICDGKKTTPFGTIYSALESVKSMSSEETIEIYIEACDKQTPYLILDSELSPDISYYSPFSDFKGTTIKISAIQSALSTAFISLRTAKFIIEAKSILIMENINIDGRDFSVIKKGGECLSTSAGCCFDDLMYFDTKNPCFTYGQGVRGGIKLKDGQKYFSFINGEAGFGLKSVTLTNISISYFNPRDSYLSFLSIGTSASDCTLFLNNITLNKYYFDVAPIIITVAVPNQSSIIDRLVISNFIEKNFNPFLVQSKNLEKPLVLIEEFGAITFQDLFIGDLFTRGFTFSFRNCDEIRISKAIIEKAHGGFIDASSNQMMLLSNIIFRNIEYYEGRLTYFFQAFNVYKLEIVNNIMNNCKLEGLLGPFFISSVSELIVEGLIIDQLKAKKTGSFELINVKDSNIIYSKFQNIWVSIGGMINSLEDGKSLKITDCLFKGIYGPRGSIFSLKYGSNLNVTTIRNIMFRDIDCANGFCFEFQSTNASTILFHNITCIQLKGSQHFLRIINENSASFKLITLRVDNLLLQDSNISLFSFDSELLITTLTNLILVNCYSKNYLLFKIYGIERVYFANLSVINCRNHDFLGMKFEYVKRRSDLMIKDAVFENITGDGSLHITRMWALLKNCSFTNTSGKTTAFYVYGTNNFLNFQDIIFFNQALNIFSGLFLHVPNKTYSFSNCTFLNIRFLVTGSLIMFPNDCWVELISCKFQNISGTGVYLLGIGNNVSVFLHRTRFIDIRLTGKGGVFLMVQINQVFMNECMFESVEGQYNGVISYIERWSYLWVTRCSLKKVFGSTGAAFFLAKEAILYVNNTFIKEIYSYLNGGVVSALGFTYIIIENSFLTNITSFYSGGIIFIEGDSRKSPKGSIIFKNNHLASISCRQDGALMYLKSLEFVRIENIKAFNTLAINAGSFFFSKSNFINITKALIWGPFVYEKAGCIWVETTGEMLIQDLSGYNVSSKNIGVFLIVADTNFRAVGVQVFNSFGSTLINIVNEGYTNVTLQEIFLRTNQLSKVIDVTNKHPVINNLLFNMNILIAEENYLNSFLSSYRSFLELKQIRFSNNIEEESFDNQILVEISRGQCIFINSHFEKEGFKNLILFYQTESVKMEGTVFYLGTHNQNFFTANSVFNISIENSCFFVSSMFKQTLTIFSFNMANSVSIRNLTVNGSSQNYMNLAKPCVIQSRNSSLEINTVIMSKLYLEESFLFDLVLTLGANLTMRNIGLYDLTSISGSIRIDVNPLTHLIVEKFILRNNQNGVSSRLTMQITCTNLGIPPSAEKKFNFSDISSVNYDFSLTLTAFESPVVLSNISVSYKQFDLWPSPSIIFRDCFYVEAQFLNLSNNEGLSGLDFSSHESIQVSSLLLRDSIFENCRCRKSGGALFFSGSIDIKILNTKIRNNSALYKGGAIYIRNPNRERGSFTLNGTEIVGNTAELSAPAISYVTRNPRVIKSFEELIQAQANKIENNTKFGKNTSEHFPQVSSLPVYYNISIVAHDNNESLIYTSSSQEEFDMGSLKILTFSGRPYWIELEIFDIFKQESLDLSGLSVKCEPNASEKVSKSLIFYNNFEKIQLNKVNLTKFQIVTRKSLFESTFVCTINFGGPSSDDLLGEYFSTDPVTFKVKECQIGQILREDRCVTCQNSYSFEKKITSLTYCFPCPPNSNCFADVIIPNPGYWNFNTTTLKVIKCIKRESCLGGKGAPCGEGHSGNLCYNCLPARGKLYDHSCIPCNESGFIILTAFRILVLYGLLVLLCHLALNINNKKEFPNLLLIVRSLIDFIEVFNILFLINFEDIPVFEHVRAFLTIFSFFGDFSLIEDCFANFIETAEHRFLAKSLIGLLVPFLLSMFAALTLRKASASHLRTDSFLTSLGICLYTFFVQVSKVFFSTLYCENLSISVNSNLKFLVEAPDILCYTQGQFITMIPIVLMKLCYLAVLYKFYRREKKKQTFNYFTDLFVKYFKKGFYEVIILFTKLIIVMNYLNTKYVEKTSYISFNIVCLMIYLLFCVVTEQNTFWTTIIGLNYIVLYVNSIIIIGVGPDQHDVRNLVPLFLTAFFIIMPLLLIIWLVVWAKRSTLAILKRS